MKASLLVLVCLVPGVVWAQINYNGGSYTQDFNSLQNDSLHFKSYTNMPAGWFVSQRFYVASDGTNGFSNNAGTYCFTSAAGAEDKALGLVIGSTGPGYFGAQFRNMTGVTLTSFAVGYFAEQWVKGAVTNQDQVTLFQYSLGATSLTNGLYTNYPPLDLHSIHDGDGHASALDGNAATNRQWLSGTVAGISWAPNQDLWIRWAGVSYPFFQNNAMAVDDLVFSAVPGISAAAQAGGLVLSWPTNAPGYVLQTADDWSATNWVVLTNTPMVTNSQFSVMVTATNAQQFFRLSKTGP